MAIDGEGGAEQPEDEMLPDERALIAERAGDLDELGEEEYLTTEEVAERLGIELDQD